MHNRTIVMLFLSAFVAGGIIPRSAHAAASIVGFSEPGFPAADSFDKLKALKAIYGELTPSKGGGNAETVLWLNVNVPKPLSQYFHSVPKGIVQLVYDAPFKEGGIEKHIILTATKPADKDYQCHACGLLIGGAVFSRSADGWLIESQNKYIAVEGKFGSVEKETISLIAIGPDRYGVLFRGTDYHQGYASNYVSLLVPYGKSIIESLLFFVEGPSDGACPDAVWEQGLELKPVKRQKDTQGYYDMEADVRCNSGECGKAKPVRETAHFRFNNGKYVQSK